jgi:hypothetical protein
MCTYPSHPFPLLPDWEGKHTANLCPGKGNPLRPGCQLLVKSHGQVCGLRKGASGVECELPCIVVTGLSS